MTTYDQLPAEDQQSLDDFLNSLVRPWAGEQAKANNHGGAADTQYNANVSAILAVMTGTDEIPNKSGLAGAIAITKDEAVSIVSHIQGIRTTYNTAAHRQLWAKAAGAGNLIG